MKPAHSCADWDALLGYRLGELSPAEEAQLEEKLFSCDACARRLETLWSITEGVRALFAGGAVAAAVTVDVLELAERQGLRLRTYRIPEGAQVPCTAAPDDDFVVVRLPLPTGRFERVDVTLRGHLLASHERSTERLEDVAVDDLVKELVMLVPGERIRNLPRSRWRYDVRVLTEGEERDLGPYLLDHTPWEERSQGSPDSEA